MTILTNRGMFLNRHGIQTKLFSGILNSCDRGKAVLLEWFEDWCFIKIVSFGCYFVLVDAR